MMKIYSYLILATIFAYNYSFGQYVLNDIQGDWVQYKVEMKDGSRIYNRSINDSSYLQFSFINNTMSIVSEPVYITKPLTISFTLNKNEIKLNSNGSYLIENIKNDTLIIADNYADTADKLKRYYLVKESTFINNLISSQNKNFVANRFTKPKLKNRLNTNDLPNMPFKVKGMIRVHIDSKEILVTIESPESINNTVIKRLTTILEKSYNAWDLTKFADITYIDIPFFAMSREMHNTKMKSYSTTIDFIVAPINFYDEQDHTTLKNMSLSTQHFKDGLIAYKNSDFPKALEFFSMSFDADKYNLEALYNKAAINYYLGKKDQACKDWNYLSLLGQKRAEKEILQYCK